MVDDGIPVRRASSSTVIRSAAASPLMRDIVNQRQAITLEVNDATIPAGARAPFVLEFERTFDQEGRMSADADHEVIDSPEALFHHLYEAHHVEEALDLDPETAPVQFWLRRHAELERQARA